MLMARSSFVAIVATAILTATAPSRGEQPEAVAPSPFGVCCPWPGIDTAGIKWCRVGAGATAFVNWQEIEKSPGTWDWTAADAELKRLADPMKLSLLPIFGYTPKWASRQPTDKEFQFHPPRDVAWFARFVHQSVARYRERVKVWEVWNEPDDAFFRGSVAEYAETVKAAAVAARQADPDCRLAMGCAGVDIPFLERLYEFGCGPYFDVMAVHPYQWGRELNDRWMIDKLQACRRLMDRHGDRHKEIWATEFGWSIGDGVTAAGAGRSAGPGRGDVPLGPRAAEGGEVLLVRRQGLGRAGLRTVGRCRQAKAGPAGLSGDDYRLGRCTLSRRVANARAGAGPRLRSRRQADAGALDALARRQNPYGTEDLGCRNSRSAPWAIGSLK